MWSAEILYPCSHLPGLLRGGVSFGRFRELSNGEDSPTWTLTISLIM